MSQQNWSHSPKRRFLSEALPVHLCGPDRKFDLIICIPKRIKNKVQTKVFHSGG